MSTNDRLDRLEEERTIGQVITSWLGDAHTSPDLDTYLRTQTREGAPYTQRLLRGADQVVANGPFDGEALGRARLQARVSVRFASNLAFLMSIAAEKIVNLLGPQTALLLLTAPWRGPDSPKAGRRSRPSQHVSSVETVKRLLADRAEGLDAIEVEAQARKALEAQFFDRRSVLFPDTESAWESLKSQAQVVRRILQVEDGPARRRRIAVQAEARRSELFDEARMKTLEELGRPDLVKQITEWRFVGERPRGGRLVEPTGNRRELIIPSGFLDAFERELKAERERGVIPE